MQRTLSEQKVLQKLGIPDFRHMTKDKVVQFTSMLHRMDPAVAMKVLEQFPNYTQLAGEMIQIYRDVSTRIMEANTSSMKPFYDACSSILNSLQKQLDDDDITSEEKATINRQMIEVAKMIGEKDTENKHFLATIGQWGLKIGGIVLGFAAVILGGKWLSTKDE